MLNWSKIKRVLRIVLMCIIFIICTLPILGMLTALYNQVRFDNSMVLPVINMGFAIGSILFHLEVLNIIKPQENKTVKPNIKLVYWVLNVALGIIFIAFSWFLYSMVSKFPSSQTELALKFWAYVFIAGILLIGVINLIDMLFVFAFIKRDKTPEVLSDIDEIGN